MPEFDLDENGEVVLKPITAYRVEPVATIAALLQVEYAENEAALENGSRERKQFVLYPQQALYLAEALRRAAEPLLGPLPLGNMLG